VNYGTEADLDLYYGYVAYAVEDLDGIVTFDEYVDDYSDYETYKAGATGDV
jgi:hypothetical protein